MIVNERIKIKYIGKTKKQLIAGRKNNSKLVVGKIYETECTDTNPITGHKLALIQYNITEKGVKEKMWISLGKEFQIL